MHKYFSLLLLNLRKRRQLIRGRMDAYFYVFVGKDGHILMKPLCAHCSILAVLSSRLLKLQVWGCQRLCSNKPWLCTQANYCWSPREPDYFLTESAWAAAEWVLCAKPFVWVLLFSVLNPEIEAEQKLSNLPEAEERPRLQGERGGAGDSQDTFTTWQIVLSYQHALQGKLTT